jgi:methylenetetrahydrofolate reductase (NADPH)
MQERRGTLEGGEAPPSEALRAQLMKLFAHVSIEALPHETAGHEAAWEALPGGTRIFLTRLPRADFGETVEAAKRLRQRGLIPVPHLAARAVDSQQSLDEALARLRCETGVDDILLIAGSNLRAAGPFENTLQVIETGSLQRAGIRRLGVAGHPEGHPQADQSALEEALAAKAAFGRAAGIEIYVVTQFFFDAAPVIAWEKRIRAAGIALPIHPGLYGLTSMARLMRYALSCGIGASLEGLRQRSTGFLGLAAAEAPDRLAVELARASLADPDLRISTFHLFPLGGLAATVSWANAMRQGRFELTREGALKVEV